MCVPSEVLSDGGSRPPHNLCWWARSRASRHLRFQAQGPGRIMACPIRAWAAEKALMPMPSRTSSARPLGPLGPRTLRASSSMVGSQTSDHAWWWVQSPLRRRFVPLRSPPAPFFATPFPRASRILLLAALRCGHHPASGSVSSDLSIRLEGPPKPKMPRFAKCAKSINIF